MYEFNIEKYIWFYNNLFNENLDSPFMPEGLQTSKSSPDLIYILAIGTL